MACSILPTPDRLANDALTLWDLPPGASARLINVSENHTYLVEAPGGFKAVLRLHRPGYHTRRAIACELAWMAALTASGTVATPEVIVGLNGDAVQNAGAGDASRYAVLFDFIAGAAPDETGDLTAMYERLGAIAARCHAQAIAWQKPAPFERLTWDDEAVFGQNATWGDWRDAPEVTPDVRTVLERVEETVRMRLVAYGKSPDRYNLIHADMRFANLLIDRSDIRLIDFDDCGMGWLMYDFAAAISFVEDDPRVLDWKAAWLRGYRTVRFLPVADEAEIDTLIMLRRMALLAWIGSHADAPEPMALSNGFAATTARLGQAWLNALQT